DAAEDPRLGREQPGDRDEFPRAIEPSAAGKGPVAEAVLVHDEVLPGLVLVRNARRRPEPIDQAAEGRGEVRFEDGEPRRNLGRTDESHPTVSDESEPAIILPANRTTA